MARRRVTVPHVNFLRRLAERSGQLVFDPAADSVEAVERSEVLRYRWVCNWAKGWDLPSARVLDLGCWTGGFLYQLDRGVGCGEIQGVDLDGPWLAIAQKVVPSGTINKITDLFSLRSAVLGDFDFVFLLETVEHLPRGTEGRTLRAITEVMAPGGSLIISTPVAGPLTLLDPAWLMLGHRHYRPSTLTSILEAAGLEVVETGYAGNAWEATGEIRYLAIKHLRHRIPNPHPYLQRHADTGIRQKRYLGATGFYVRARKP